MGRRPSPDQNRTLYPEHDRPSPRIDYFDHAACNQRPQGAFFAAQPRQLPLRDGASPLLHRHHPLRHRGRALPPLYAGGKHRAEDELRRTKQDRFQTRTAQRHRYLFRNERSRRADERNVPRHGRRKGEKIFHPADAEKSEAAHALPPDEGAREGQCGGRRDLSQGPLASQGSDVRRDRFRLL